MSNLRIGDLTVKSLTDGPLATSVEQVIGMERAQAEQLLGGTQAGSLFIPVNVFLIERADKTILIDAGAGTTMQPTLGKLPENLRAAGIDPSSITHVVVTHIHRDHTNGLIDPEGRPQYPNAEIVVHEKELDFWLGPAARPQSEKVERNRAQARINLTPYLDRVRTVRDGEDILGMTPILAPGHTPGHTCWRIGSGREAALAWGDLVHFSAIQISHPDVAVAYDLDKDVARASRLRILDMAATEHWGIAGAHVGAPGLGYVVRRGGRYAFEPAGA